MNSPDPTDGSDPNEVADLVAKLHSECATQLIQLAWAIVRDWGLAADAAQETFALFAQKCRTIPPDQRRGWLFKTVQFQALNLRRSQQRSNQLLDRLREQPTQYQIKNTLQNPAQDTDHQEQIEQLRKSILALPFEQQQIVQLRIAEERGFAEIAAQLNLPLGTVLSRMRLALEKLRRSLPNDEA